MSLSNISFRKKIFLLLFFPIVAFLFLAVSDVITNADKNQAMERLKQQITLSVIYSELVHELQKERGASAGYLGSKGTSFKSKLQAQRELTNQKINQRKQTLANLTIQSHEIKALNNSISQALNQINDIRTKVDQLSISTKQALGFYTALNANLLSVSSIISQLSSDANISNSIIAYYNFLQGKERAGIERAVLSNTFALDRFAPSMFERFIRLESEQDTYFSNFLTFASNENQHELSTARNSSTFANVFSYRKIAKEHATTGGFNKSATDWFDKSTQRIKELKRIENLIAQRLLTQVAQANNHAFHQMLISIFQSIVLILISTTMSYFIIKNLNNQVKGLTTVIKQVRNNNDLTVRVVDTGESELGQIGAALNLTLETFSAAINEILSSSQSLAASAAQTSETCTDNSDALRHQQEEIMQIATAVEELSATYKEVANNTQSTADAAKETDEQASEGLSKMQASYLSIENLSNEINTLSERVGNLHESSNNITSVVDVIKTVAEQTNLLALNAAIEAARAGEQGRGFAVVADEVRTLAQRTQHSTVEIETFISKLQADADAAYSVIESSREKAAIAVENSKSVEQNLSGITASVNNMFSMSEQIASAVEEQAMVTQDVAKSVVNVEGNSMQTTTGATQIAATAKEQAHLATSLQQIASTFKV